MNNDPKILLTETTEDEWREIPGYEGLYRINKEGVVQSINRTVIGKDGRPWSFRGKTLSPYIHRKKKYRYVTLYKNNHGKNWGIHHLIASAWIPNPENKPYVDHIDTNPLNNSIDNLRWVTPKENSNNVRTLQNHKEAKSIMQGSVVNTLRECTTRLSALNDTNPNSEVNIVINKLNNIISNYEHRA